MFWRNSQGVFLALLLIVFPSLAAAQSQISGVVRDESGAVLPGVTVEVSSPVLIEKTRTTVTNNQGLYSLIDLRPGTYKMTFSLSGFSVVARENVELPANFTATVNADMKVGALEETITVSGDTSVVDVQQASRTQVLTRDLLDTLPSAHTLQTIGSAIPGVKTTSPDVGGTRMTLNTGQTSRGMQPDNNIMQVDGMAVTGGSSLGYLNDSINAEVSLTTSGIPAEVSGGGVRINSIPKDGGNVFSGSSFLGYSDGGWQSDNLDPEELKNVVAPSGIESLTNFNGSLAGPLRKDKLWFFIAGQHLETNNLVVNGITKDGTQLIEDQYVRNLTGRLTYQINQKHKVAATLDRVFKKRGTILPVGTDPKAMSTRSPQNGIYMTGQSKYTGTLTNRWLVEGGFSDYLEHYRTTPLEGRYYARGTPEWLANARRSNNVLFQFAECELVSGCNIWRTSGTDSRNERNRYYLSSSATYVTGSHQFKTGVQWSFGHDDSYNDQQADLNQIYRNGAPNQVQISNSPRISYTAVNYDLGIYLQDTWRIKRLSLSPGLRIENLNARVPESSMAAGRFVPARFYPAQDNLPNWKGDLAPRLAAAYDVFGDGRTAIKGNISRYYEQIFASFATRYGPVVNSTSTYNWTDLNVDDIAQEIEFINNAGSNANFGKTIVTRAPDADIQRAYNMEYSIQMQRELIPRVSVTVGYFRRVWKNVEASDNTLQARADWLNPLGREFQVPNPLEPGQMLKAYQLNPTVRGQSFTLDYTDKPYRAQYDGLEFSYQARLQRGVTVFGGVTLDRHQTVDCGSADDPNATGTDRYLGHTIARGAQAGPDGTPWCDQSEIGMPWRTEVKIAGSVPIWYGIETALSFRGYPGDQYTYTYALQNTDFPGGTNVGTAQTLLLTQPGTLFYPRFNQLDMNFKKVFRYSNYTFTGTVDVFNVTNANTIFATNTAVALTNTGAVNPSLDDVTAFLQGRMLRLSFNFRF